MFDDLYAEGDSILNGNIYGNGRVDILMCLHNDVQMAGDGFQARCETIPQVTYGGSGDNQYCMSQVVELRESPDSFCQPTGEYNSEVIFLKDRLTISFERYTGDAESPELDAAILKIAKAFKKSRPPAKRVVLTEPCKGSSLAAPQGAAFTSFKPDALIT